MIDAPGVLSIRKNVGVRVTEPLQLDCAFHSWRVTSLTMISPRTLTIKNAIPRLGKQESSQGNVQ